MLPWVDWQSATSKSDDTELLWQQFVYACDQQPYKAAIKEARKTYCTEHEIETLKGSAHKQARFNIRSAVRARLRTDGHARLAAALAARRTAELEAKIKQLEDAATPASTLGGSTNLQQDLNASLAAFGNQLASTLGDSLGDLGRRNGPQSHGGGSRAPSSGPPRTSVMLKRPHAISQLVADVRLGLGPTTPDGQLRTAMAMLDQSVLALVTAKIRTRGRRLADLDDLAEILRMLFPTHDETARSLELILGHLLKRPTNSRDFEPWAQQLLQAATESSEGLVTLPPFLVSIMLLLGLANVAGTTSPSGIHTRLRTAIIGTKIDGMSTPADVLASVSQFWLSQSAAATAAAALNDAQPTKRIRINHLDVDICSHSTCDHEHQHRDHGHDHAHEQHRDHGHDRSHSTCNHEHQHRDHGHDHAHEHVDQATTVLATAVDFRGAAKKKVFCPVCTGQHAAGDCRGRAVPGVSIRDREVSLPAGLDKSHPNAPCARHLPRFPGGRSSHTNRECKARPGTMLSE
jgi:hypothetical protein